MYMFCTKIEENIHLELWVESRTHDFEKNIAPGALFLCTDSTLENYLTTKTSIKPGVEVQKFNAIRVAESWTKTSQGRFSIFNT